MQATDKPIFFNRLQDLLASYGQALPEGAIGKAWWRDLDMFPLALVNLALTIYADQNATFAPHPAAIRKLCKEHDGRPGAEEAWAIAIQSRNEADTVVWTEEIAQAYATCSPILHSGDEVGARMAFKEAYQRLSTHGRASNQMPVWVASPGWDKQRMKATLQHSRHKNLLTQTQVAELLLSAPIEAADVVYLADLADLTHSATTTDQHLLPNRTSSPAKASITDADVTAAAMKGRTTGKTAGKAVETAARTHIENSTASTHAREQLRHLKQWLATLEPSEAKLTRVAQERAERERATTAVTKDKLERQVREYGRGGVDCASTAVWLAEQGPEVRLA